MKGLVGSIAVVAALAALALWFVSAEGPEDAERLVANEEMGGFAPADTVEHALLAPAQTAPEHELSPLSGRTDAAIEARVSDTRPTLSGRVLDAAGRPVSSAWVRVLDASGNSSLATTVTGGAFAVRVPSGQGPYEVSANRDRAYSIRRNVVAGAGELVLRLESHVLRGWVVDDLGEPVPEFEVQTSSAAWGASGLGGAGRRGLLEIADLPPGECRVEVHALGWRQVEPCRVTLPCEGVEIRMVHDAEVRGVVLDALGRPVPRASVHAQTATAFLDVRSGADGEFAMPRIPAGQVTLYALRAGFGSSDPVTLDLAPGQLVDGLVLELDASAKLIGTLLDGRGRPVAGAIVQAGRAGELRTVSATTDGRGHFHLPGLCTGDVFVHSEIGGRTLSRRLHLEPGEVREVVLEPEGPEPEDPPGGR